MDKKVIIKNCVSFLAILISFIFLMYTGALYETFNVIGLFLSFLVALSIAMLYKYIKENVSNTYKICMILLLIFSFLFILNIYASLNTISVILFIISSLATLFINDKINNKTSIINYYLTILTSFIVIYIHLKYLLNSGFRTDNLVLRENSINFITQNYIYFGIMYSVIIINQFKNKIISKK